MGVNDLWGVLEPAGSECSLRDLRGKTLAVDTSIWLYQGQVAGKQLHLRSGMHSSSLFVSDELYRLLGSLYTI